MRTQAEWNVITHIDRARRADQRGDPGRHLAGRLVGEGDGQDLVRRHVPRGQQVGDPVGEHPGLARARAGHDKQRAALVHDGSALLRIESVEKGIYREGGHLHRVGARTDKAGGAHAAAPTPRVSRTHQK